VRVIDGPVTQGRRGDPRTSERRTIGWDDGRPIYLFSTDSPLRSTAGDLEDMPLYAGMGVGRVTKMTTAGQRVRMLVEEAESVLALPAGDAGAALASPVCYAGINPEYMGYLRHDALLDALGALRRDAAAALRAAARGSSRQRRLARWLIGLQQLIGELAGEIAPLPEDAGSGSAADMEAALAAEARALLPTIFEDRVRQVLEALLTGHAGAAPAPAVAAGPMPPESLRASAR
jgi:hypothetical protein